MSGHFLVVDFDFFFPNPAEAPGLTADMSEQALYDWGHQESPLYLSTMLWAIRASSFLTAGRTLPQIQPPDGGFATFWDRFTFAPQAAAGWADSNAVAGTITPDDEDGWTTVTLFDAHHDSGYRVASVADWHEQGTFSCEDWMIAHHVAGCDDLTVRYPTWKPRGPSEPIPHDMPTTQMVDDGHPLPTPVDALFVCKSGAWVPAWCDRDFAAFLDACPLPIAPLTDDPLDRGLDLNLAHQIADVERQVLHRPDSSH